MTKKPRNAAFMTPEERREFGRIGGSVKCPKGLAMYSPSERSENARRGSLARWAKYRASQASGLGVVNT